MGLSLKDRKCDYIINITLWSLRSGLFAFSSGIFECDLHLEK